MIKIEIKNENEKASVEMVGGGMGLLLEATEIAKQMHHALERADPTLALAFKKILMREDGPVWGEKP
jgi:hypothetical protein